MAEYIVHHFLRVATEFTPQTFGRLTTVGPVFKVGNTRKQVVLCDCGEIVVTYVGNMVYGSCQSCGCLAKEKRIASLTKHGECGSVEHYIWGGMKERCYNKNSPSYSRYGGRGIFMCPTWESTQTGFLQFVADMGRRPSPQHSLDRIDVNGPYSPENCRWATMIEQQNNRRNTPKFTINGVTKSLADWARTTGISHRQAAGRVRRGWKITDAINPNLTRKPK